MGGVEAVLQHHYENDSRFGLDSAIVAYYEKPRQHAERLHFLGFDGKTTVREARRRLGSAIGLIKPEVTIHHGMWGMPFLADLDGARRRLLMLHGHVPRMEELLLSRAPYVDAMICVSQSLRDTVHKVLPSFDRARSTVLPYPIAPPAAGATRLFAEKRRIIIGFSGRLVFEQKRIDRLPAVFQALDQLGIPFRFEFLGEGPDAGWLRERLKGRDNFVFHGRQQGERYWNIIRQWDVILFVSDYEGTPISLLEALSQGVIPIYPNIGSGGEVYTRMVDPRLVYEPDDVKQLTDLVQFVSRLSHSADSELRANCLRAISDHLGDSYLSKFAAFVHSVDKLQRRSKLAWRGRFRLFDLLSFAARERLANCRRRIQSLVRQTPA